MEHALVVRGRLTGPTSVELDEPVSASGAEVEVIVRGGSEVNHSGGEDILDLLRRIPPGTRSKEDIDRQIREERDSWGEP